MTGSSGCAFGSGSSVLSMTNLVLAGVFIVAAALLVAAFYMALT